MLHLYKTMARGSSWLSKIFIFCFVCELENLRISECREGDRVPQHVSEKKKKVSIESCGQLWSERSSKGRDTLPTSVKEQRKLLEVGWIRVCLICTYGMSNLGVCFMKAHRFIGFFFFICEMLCDCGEYNSCTWVHLSCTEHTEGRCSL